MSEKVRMVIYSGDKAHGAVQKALKSMNLRLKPVRSDPQNWMGSPSCPRIIEAAIAEQQYVGSAASAERAKRLTKIARKLVGPRLPTGDPAKKAAR